MTHAPVQVVDGPLINSSTFHNFFIPIDYSGTFVDTTFDDPTNPDLTSVLVGPSEDDDPLTQESDDDETFDHELAFGPTTLKFERGWKDPQPTNVKRRRLFAPTPIYPQQSRVDNYLNHFIDFFDSPD